MPERASTISALSTSDFAWLLGSLCQTHRIPWDSALALQLFPPPYFLATLREAGAHYGFRFGETQTGTVDWSSATLPTGRRRC